MELDIIVGQGKREVRVDVDPAYFSIDSLGRLVPSSSFLSLSVPISGSIAYNGIDIPDNFLLEDGSSLSRVVYATLYNFATKSKGTFTVTSANPGVVTLAGHGLLSGDCFEVTTTGAAPTNMVVNTNYYVEYINANTFYFHATQASAIAGTPGGRIDCSAGVQAGVHTLRHTPWGVDGANNFLLPDKRGVDEEGAGQQSTAAWAAAEYTGGLGHYKQDQGQEISGTLSITGAIGFSDAATYSGVFTKGAAWAQIAQLTPAAARLLQFNSKDSSGSRQNAASFKGPRVGVKKIIRYQ